MLKRRKIAISQLTDTPICKGKGFGWNYQYGYTRAAEARAAGECGQDYLVFEQTQDHLLFVVCDGISMSYYGELAARFLGDHLLEWLSTRNSDEQAVSELQTLLDQYLREITRNAIELLQGHHLPDHIQGMLREVLMTKKAQGSGAIYGCGRIDRPSPLLPNGRILLAWQGDVRIRLWTDGMEQKGLLGKSFDNALQWNSIVGAVGGKPHIYTDTTRDWKQGAVLLYSDGLKTLDSFSEISTERLSQVMEREAEDESSDDMSVFYADWDFT